MQLTSLQFPSIRELMEFEMSIESYGHIVDHTACAITGNFTAQEIALAIHSYKALASEAVL